jgi:predicted MFS family arabinose efflux permease
MSGSLWRDRNFLTLWIGQTISEIGSRITREGLPLTAVLVLNAAPDQMGILAGLGGLAALVAGPMAGSTADRRRRKPILIATDLGRALLLGLVPLLAAYGVLTIWHLYTVVFFTGIFTIYFDVAYQAYLPALVREDQLLEGNRKLAISTASAEIAGPAITGMLVQWLTAPRAIAVDALSFLASALSIGLITRHEDKPVRHESDDTDFRAGLRAVWRDRILRALWLRATTFSLFGGFFFTLYVLYAVQILKLSTVMLGLVVALGGVGNLFGALVSERLARVWPLGRILITSAFLSSSLLMLIPLASGEPLIAAAYLGVAQLLGDMWFPVYGIHEITLRQRIAPEGMLGRVNAAMQMAMRGMFPIGAVIGGFFAAQTSVRLALWVSSVGCLLSGFWLVFSPVRKLGAVRR